MPDEPRRRPLDVARRPRIATRIAEQLDARIADLVQRLADLVGKSVVERTARTLGVLAAAATAGREPEPVRLTHEQLAGLVGATRERTTTALGELAERGVVSLHRGRIRIRDRVGPAAVADGAAQRHHRWPIGGDEPGGHRAGANTDAGAVQAAHRGAPRDSEGECGLGVGKAVDVDELDHCAVHGGWRGECVGDDGLELGVDNDVLCAAAVAAAVEAPGLLLVLVQECRDAGAGPVAVGLAQDGQQSGAWVGAVEAVDGAVGAHEGVLDEVLGVGGLARHGQGHPVEDRELRLDVAGERGRGRATARFGHRGRVVVHGFGTPDGPPPFPCWECGAASAGSRRMSAEHRHPAGTTWSRPAQALGLVLRGCTVRTAAPVAAVVGTILSAVNQGDVLLGGAAGTGTWIRVAVNFLVPFCVASIGFLSACRVRLDDEPPR